MVHQKQDYNILKYYKKKSKEKVVLLFLFLCITNLYSVEYFENDFRDNTNKFYTTSSTDIKSNKLNIKDFSHKWDKLPIYKESNQFYGNSDFKIYYTFSKFNFGLLHRETLNGYMNDGFIKTWYQIENNFSGLLSNNSIGAGIGNVEIDGLVNYFKSSGLYVQKVIRKSNHYFSGKLNFLYGKELQDLKVVGKNTTDRFLLSFDYYYSESNRITKFEKENQFKGYGASIDLEYIYKNDDLYLYIGALDLGGFIQWDGITFMHYDFDSKVIYKGLDGYNHYKPFGTGFYKYDRKYVQKILPTYKTSIDYKVNNIFNIGLNTSLFDDSFYNETYITSKTDNFALKVGYLVENKNLVIGCKYKDFMIELSNKLGSSDVKTFTAEYKINLTDLLVFW